jgi:phage tail sheath protein FI
VGVAGVSVSAKSTGSATTPNQTPDGWRYLLQKLQINKFVVPLYGGSDGLDIREREPFRNKLTSPDGTTAKTHYAYNTIEEALDIVANTEDYEYNIACMPGITTPGLTKKLVDICETRADALAIIDLEDVYTPTTEETKTNVTDRYGNVRNVTTKLMDRQLNSSYGCCYYPWVQIQDSATGINMFAPPSIVALGTMGSSEAVSEPWFAPAGFNRGGLTDGAAGIPVIGITEKLTAKNRDKLYEANINPIASFPAEGIVVFGQKTLQITPSALDRINVRRLLIFVKKAVSRFSAKVLFDQNVQVTWNRFLGMVEPFLKSVQTRLGLSDFRITLDSTTTTPDLIDRNIMYAKIYLKPARAIEFIVVDFVITSSGASFDD